ncbi:acetyltransferase component of pyruvate dehydrogenase complex [Amycolatopsis deserti]|uniref:Dihydrolipoamide acetyltransferase component of pyruvate dehydrogenase complex n=2 Tax=Amycolatopsis deserti TaxID=185696 RepID=A0ABQ3IH50_9PSEU|nr:acetyltransferase component of pyruvate dehydrogenase complex [Amycolatopsis deserti]
MYTIRLPRLGQTMESGTITQWHFAEGDRFTAGEPLYDVETEKMNTEVEAKQDGVLARIVTASGDNVPVGTVLAVAAEVGETFSGADIEAVLGEHSGQPAEAATTESASDEQASQPPSGDQAPAREMAVAGLAQGPVRAVPKARRVARQLGVDLESVRGSGQNGVIRVSDVESASGTAGYVGAPRVAERIPVRGVAKAMADAMTRSWREIPQFVQQISLDATALRARLKRLRYEGVQVTYTDLLIAAVASAVSEVPAVNSTFTDEEIIRYSDVNVSFAVAADRGLLVPVVRQANRLPIDRIGATTKELAERARAGKLRATDISDGTITVSNLGAFGVETGTPIVNAPQSAIIFVGALSDRAIVEDGQVVVRPMLNIAVAYDHRVIDGMTGAKFTSALKNRLEAGG